jgi:hypothetical protein
MGILRQVNTSQLAKNYHHADHPLHLWKYSFWPKSDRHICRPMKTASLIFLSLYSCSLSSVRKDSLLSNCYKHEFQFLYDWEIHVKSVFVEIFVVSCFTDIFIELEYGCKYKIFYRHLSINRMQSSNNRIM